MSRSDGNGVAEEKSIGKRDQRPNVYLFDFVYILMSVYVKGKQHIVRGHLQLLKQTMVWIIIPWKPTARGGAGEG